jgi:Transposase, Mutator family
LISSGGNGKGVGSLRRAGNSQVSLSKRGWDCGRAVAGRRAGLPGIPVSRRRCRWPGECVPPRRAYLNPALLERLNQEIKRRTHVVRIFPGTESCPRLVRTRAGETHENWLEAIRYRNMEHLRAPKKEALRALAA